MIVNIQLVNKAHDVKLMLTCSPVPFPAAAADDRQCVTLSLNWIPLGPIQSSNWCQRTWEQSSSSSPPVNPEAISQTQINYILPRTCTAYANENDSVCSHLDWLPAPAISQLLWLLQEELTAVMEGLLLHTQFHHCKRTWWRVTPKLQISRVAIQSR